MGPSWGHLEAFLGNLGAILGHCKALQGQERRTAERNRIRQANLAKIARRLGESTIFEGPGDHVEAFLGPSWVIVGLLGAILRHRGAISGNLGSIHLEAILCQLKQSRAILGPLGALFGSSWGQLGANLGCLGAILGHFKALKRQERRTAERNKIRQTNLAKFARRPGESAIFEFPGDHVEAFLGPSWPVLGHLGSILAPFGPSWANFAHHGPS